MNSKRLGSGEDKDLHRDASPLPTRPHFEVYCRWKSFTPVKIAMENQKHARL